MPEKTITFKCNECGQELTFYIKTSDGHRCAICNCPLIKPLGYNIRSKEEVKTTRELYKKQSKNSPRLTIEEALNS